MKFVPRRLVFASLKGIETSATQNEKILKGFVVMLSSCSFILVEWSRGRAIAFAAVSFTMWKTQCLRVFSGLDSVGMSHALVH